MEVKCDKANLIKIQPQVSSFDGTEKPSLKTTRKQRNPTNQVITRVSKPLPNIENRITAKETILENEETAEERQRTGRYLAIGVTIIMLFIAFYHTLLRHATVLAGLLAPAIIMLLYILWLFYFAKKKRTQVSAV